MVGIHLAGNKQIEANDKVSFTSLVTNKPIEIKAIYL